MSTDIYKQKKYRVVKTYGNERGFSCVFRQHKAESHCRFLHGYSLGFSVEFECSPDELTEEGWVVDFGSLGRLERYLENTFDHKLLIARDDEELRLIEGLDKIARPQEVPATGCEAFARLVYAYVYAYVSNRIVSVRCFEHGANSAIYEER